MSRLIKIIDENTIELAEYRNPEAMFKSSENPPTLQNIKDEIEHLEWYCTFKAIINPFQMYVENERLNNRVSELEKAVSRKEEQITDLDDENFDLENEIEKLNNIINEFEDFITNVDSHINLGNESEEFILVRDKWLELQELKGSDSNSND